MPKLVLLALALAAMPAFAQSSTTVTTQQQPAQPPSSSTTVTTQPAQPPPPSTQVVVNPNDPGYVPPAEVTEVRTAPTGRSAAAIIATDALYGGFAGALVGGGITLIDQGNYWQRDLMVGAGIGILAGAAIGIYEATIQPQPTVVRRAAADPSPGASSGDGMQLLAASGRF